MISSGIIRPAKILKSNFSFKFLMNVLQGMKGYKRWKPREGLGNY